MTNTIVLIHGLWMTPLSWRGWADRFRNRGYQVITPTWPCMGHSIDELRANPSLVGGLGSDEVTDSHADLIAGLDEAPIIIGHSMGGLVTELLLDRGLGAAGVAIHPAATKGVYRLPPVQLRAGWPVVKNPFNLKKGISLTPKQFHWGFANSLSTEDALKAWETYHVPGPARLVFQVALANMTPGAATKVDYRKEDRAPLLLVAGGIDRIVPASIVRENHMRYKAGVVDYLEYPGRSHFTAGEPGWENVADEVLDWAVAHL